MASSVLISGEGVAASCCGHLLTKAGLAVDAQTGGRPRVPAIMLGDAAQKLLADVFERQDLFNGLPRIRKRIVAWGRNAEPLPLPHSAVVVSENALLGRIQSKLPDLKTCPDRDVAWTIFASRPLPPPAEDHHFGSRLAIASPVALKPGTESDACWIESLDEGWLFLLPSDEQAWLLSVGGPPDALLARSRLIAGQIDEIRNGGGSFPSHPRIAEPLCEPGWLACGTAALGFDPLCGDGTGHAVREAILASAVVRAAIGGADARALIAHYQTRLVAGFKRHLENCCEFYAAGRSGPWWDEELSALDKGLAWCNRQLESATRFRFRLNGFALEPVD